MARIAARRSGIRSTCGRDVPACGTRASVELLESREVEFGGSARQCVGRSQVDDVLCGTGRFRKLTCTVKDVGGRTVQFDLRVYREVDVRLSLTHRTARHRNRGSGVFL